MNQFFKRAGFASIFFLVGGLAMNQPARAALFGIGEKEASVKIANGGEIRGKSKVAIAAFRVVFVTDDMVRGSTSGIAGAAAAKISATLVGVDRNLMQKITDEIYADFLKKAASKSYTVIESTELASSAPAYASLSPAENFAVGRQGTYVIPTGQRSVALATDSRAKDERGTAGFAARFNFAADQATKVPTYNAFAQAAKQTEAAIWAVTIVANFADFQGSGSFGGASASIKVGATVDGHSKKEISPATLIQGWNSGSGDCVLCQTQVTLEGQIHSDEPIGSYEVTGTEKSWTGSFSSQSGVFTAEPAAYAKSIQAVVAQAVNMLLGAAAADR